MLVSALLCYWSFGLLRLSSPLVHEDVRLAAGRRAETSVLSDIERRHAPRSLHGPALLPEDGSPMGVGSYDEDPSAGVQLQGRAMRPPRRCIPHQQSCLGHPLPCCDACDTCYCRFFNAICYCRHVGHTCLPRRT